MNRKFSRSEVAVGKALPFGLAVRKIHAPLPDFYQIEIAWPRDEHIIVRSRPSGENHDFVAVAVVVRFNRIQLYPVRGFLVQKYEQDGIF